jgi:hypothetical protein
MLWSRELGRPQEAICTGSLGRLGVFLKTIYTLRELPFFGGSIYTTLNKTTGG